jgi:O-acetyl-ADP-ribose deacetylase (regulator of RNase III)
MKIILADINSVLCHAWKRDFSRYPDVKIHNGSIFDTPGNTIVSPANSFGFMTGGVDFVISDYLGWHVQERVQEDIKKRYNGELLVGQALWVKTDHNAFPFLISAPTMRVPSIITGTINAYLSTRAALNIAGKIHRLFTKLNKGEITPIFTGMGTGTGCLDPGVCSKQMLQAYEEFLTDGPPFPSSLKDKSLEHRVLQVHGKTS